MRTLFISDLHLSPSTTHLNELFERFLTEQAVHCDALYILGDLFESVIGDDDANPWFNSICHQLKLLSDTGLAIYFIRGNRDFLLGPQFTQRAGVKIINEISKVKACDQEFLLMHGDLLCLADRAYLHFRKVVQHPWVKRCFTRLPLKLRQAVAQRLRQASKRAGMSKPLMQMDASNEAIKTVLKTHHTQILIHGHTHRPGIKLWEMEDHWLQCYTLSDWDQQGSYLSVSPEGIQLQFFA